MWPKHSYISSAECEEIGYLKFCVYENVGQKNDNIPWITNKDNNWRRKSDQFEHNIGTFDLESLK